MAIMLSVIYTLPIYISFPPATKDIDIVVFNDFKDVSEDKRVIVL